MKNKRKTIFIYSLVVGIFTILIWVLTATVSETPYVTLFSSNEDELSIKDTLQRYYDLTRVAKYNYDVSEFSTVMLDDPTFSQKENESFQHFQRITPQVIKGNGWLSFQIGYIIYFKKCVEATKELTQVANSQGRSLDANDQRKIKDADLQYMSQVTKLPKKATLKYDKLKISGDRAEIYYTYGPIYTKADMLKTPKGWRVVNVTSLEDNV